MKKKPYRVTPTNEYLFLFQVKSNILFMAGTTNSLIKLWNHKRDIQPPSPAPNEITNEKLNHHGSIFLILAGQILKVVH